MIHGVCNRKTATIMINYYKDLFASSRRVDSTNVLPVVSRVITDEMNVLCGDFVESEVFATLEQMAPLKTPRLDGMPSLFYQHFWGTVNHDVTASILSWLNSGTLLSPLTIHFLLLFPRYIYWSMHTNFAL